MSQRRDISRFPYVAQTRDGRVMRTRSAIVLEKTGPWLRAGALSEADIAILDAAGDRFPLTDDAEMALAFAFALAAPRRGHLGVELTKLPERLRDERLLRRGDDGELLDLRAALPMDLADWQARVRAHPAVTVMHARTPAQERMPAQARTPTDAVTRQQPARPFVFQVLPTSIDGEVSGILMTCRMWREQQRLADGLQCLAREPADWVPNLQTIHQRLDAIYGSESAQSDAVEQDGAKPDDNSEARRAALSVATTRLTVITGGPGTGKTWGIKRVLALLIESAAAEGRSLTIELAAPTGKAAVRMAEAMASEESIPGVATATLDALKALEPRTLHRLMGMLPHKPQGFRHGKTNRLGADIVVVDEASMIDVRMMRHLVEAMADGKRLVLLGDRDQLASVDAGTVLADVVSGVFNGHGARNPALNASVARLTKSYRFKNAASVACVAQGLQSRETVQIAAAVALMCGEMTEIPGWKERIDADPRDDTTTLARITQLVGAEKEPKLPPDVRAALLAPYIDDAVENLRHNAKDRSALPPQPGYAALLRARLQNSTGDAARPGSLSDPAWHASLLEALGRYRILTAHRRGARGVSGLNGWLSVAIQAALTAGQGARIARLEKAGPHWLGQPIMITRNSYDVDLRNGDIGLIVPRKTDDGRRQLSCVFPDPRAKTETNPGIRYVSLARLPEWETALAMTVHKSQGSQFERIALVLPAESGSPILTRELVYTGLTRAKWRVDWVGERSVLADALGRDVGRASGLAGLLW